MTQRRYLLVDDDPEFLENLGEILSDSGARVLTAASGAQALALAADTPFDAVVTDMRMPGMDGAEFVHEASGYDALFTKPFETRALLERLEAMYAAKGQQ